MKIFPVLDFVLNLEARIPKQVSEPMKPMLVYSHHSDDGCSGVAYYVIQNDGRPTDEQLEEALPQSERCYHAHDCCGCTSVWKPTICGHDAYERLWFVFQRWSVNV